MTVPRVADTLHWAFLGPEGASGRVVLSWILAGGIAGGGILVGILTFSGRSNPGLQLLVAPMLFLVGTLLGLVHGLVLAVVGRPDEVRRSMAARRALFAALVASPLLGASWLITSAITVSTVLLVEFRWAWLAMGLVGWALALALCGWAAMEGLGMLRRAYTRCPRQRLGLALVAGAVLSLALALAKGGSHLPGMSRDLAWSRALPAAVAFTIWIWTPVLYLLLHRLTASRPEGRSSREGCPSPEGRSS